MLFNVQLSRQDRVDKSLEQNSEPFVAYLGPKVGYVHFYREDGAR